MILCWILFKKFSPITKSDKILGSIYSPLLKMERPSRSSVFQLLTEGNKDSVIISLLFIPSQDQIWVLLMLCGPGLPDTMARGIKLGALLTMSGQERPSVSLLTETCKGRWAKKAAETQHQRMACARRPPCSAALTLSSAAQDIPSRQVCVGGWTWRRSHHYRSPLRNMLSPNSGKPLCPLGQHQQGMMGTTWHQVS